MDLAVHAGSSYLSNWSTLRQSNTNLTSCLRNMKQNHVVPWCQVGMALHNAFHKRSDTAPTNCMGVSTSVSGTQNHILLWEEGSGLHTTAAGTDTSLTTVLPTRQRSDTVLPLLLLTSHIQSRPFLRNVLLRYVRLIYILHAVTLCACWWMMEWMTNVLMHSLPCRRQLPSEVTLLESATTGRKKIQAPSPEYAA